MKNKIKLLPFLILYILIVLLTYENEFFGDEERYILHAQYLTEGYYSPRGDDVTLLSGPGYPFVLYPFALFKIPWLAAKFLNPFFLFFAVLYFYSTLCFFTDKKKAIYFSFLLAAYPPFYRLINILYTETLTIFLVCGFIYHFCKTFKQKDRYYINSALTIFYLGYLALTKVIFGYVILILLIAFSFLYLWKKYDFFKKPALIFLFSFCMCIPYLCYTYSLTGKFFYWTSVSGWQLYYMSSPCSEELGSWISPREVIENPEIAKGHKDFYEQIRNLNQVEMDVELRKKAIKNIIDNPKNYIKNWFANVGRLLFNYPYSYDPQKLSTYYYLLPNMFIFVMSVLFIYPAFVNRKLIPGQIYILLLFFVISFCGTSLVSSYGRQFTVLVPFLAVWISIMMNNYLPLIKL